MEVPGLRMQSLHDSYNNNDDDDDDDIAPAGVTNEYMEG